MSVGNDNYIYFWKSIGLPDERINSKTASNGSLIPESSFYGSKTRIEFNGSCLKQNKVTHNHESIVNI